MIFVTLLTILISTSCVSKPPLVTINQIDTFNSKINPWRVTKYNDSTCKMEGRLLPAENLISGGKVNSKLHGGVWISFDDYKKLVAYGKTECENAKFSSTAEK